jgi:hypothetical protein
VAGGWTTGADDGWSFLQDRKVQIRSSADDT